MEELEHGPATKPPRTFLQSISEEGVKAGIEAAKVDHPSELAIQASSADHGTVKLSLSGRWRFLKAAVFGQYSHDKGAAAGGEAVIPIGHRPAPAAPDPEGSEASANTTDPRFPGA